MRWEGVQWWAAESGDRKGRGRVGEQERETSSSFKPSILILFQFCRWFTTHIYPIPLNDLYTLEPSD